MQKKVPFGQDTLAEKRGNISSRFSNNSEAYASELLENFEEMLLSSM